MESLQSFTDRTESMIAKYGFNATLTAKPDMGTRWSTCC